MKRLTLTFGLLALAAVLAACSGASAEAPTPAAPAGSPSADAVTIAAKDLKFVQTAVPVKAGAAFDLILLDPPYDAVAVMQALEAAAAVLGLDGLVVLERATRREPEIPTALARTRDVKSGDSTLTFMTRPR